MLTGDTYYEETDELLHEERAPSRYFTRRSARSNAKMMNQLRAPLEGWPSWMHGYRWEPWRDGYSIPVLGGRGAIPHPMPWVVGCYRNLILPWETVVVGDQLAAARGGDGFAGLIGAKVYADPPETERTVSGMPRSLQGLVGSVRETTVAEGKLHVAVRYIGDWPNLVRADVTQLSLHWNHRPELVMRTA